MTQSVRPTTLKQLRDSGWQSKTVKQEIRDESTGGPLPTATT